MKTVTAYLMALAPKSKTPLYSVLNKHLGKKQLKENHLLGYLLICK